MTEILAENRQIQTRNTTEGLKQPNVMQPRTEPQPPANNGDQVDGATYRQR